MSLNKILLIGNLGCDPEIRYTQTGKPVASFSLATNNHYQKEGETRLQTDWFSIVAFGRLAEICSESLKKGGSVFVEGQLRTRTWKDGDGTKHFRTEVIAQSMSLIGKREGKSETDHGSKS